MSLLALMRLDVIQGKKSIVSSLHVLSSCGKVCSAECLRKRYVT